MPFCADNSNVSRLAQTTLKLGAVAVFELVLHHSLIAIGVISTRKAWHSFVVLLTTDAAAKVWAIILSRNHGLVLVNRDRVIFDALVGNVLGLRVILHQSHLVVVLEILIPNKVLLQPAHVRRARIICSSRSPNRAANISRHRW